MTSVTPPDDAPRQTRRKAATRRRILDAADAMFAHRGYANTSLEDIAEAADVAVRTIYLHFPSKAAIFLAYFDDWLDAFVAAMRQQPVDADVPDAVESALRLVTDQGWPDRSYGEMSSPHPIVEFIGAGSPEIAGHILQSWVRGLDELTADLVARGGYPADSLEPRARSTAVFAAWMATILAARESPAAEATGNRVGVDILRAMTRPSQ